MIQQITVVTHKRLCTGGMSHDVPIKPALLAKFHLTVRTLVDGTAVHQPEVHRHARGADQLPAHLAVGLCRRVAALLMTVE